MESLVLKGFANHHESEAIKGALPKEQNSPQKPAFNLYAEQLSGSAFTRARHLNLHSWLYRILPSVVQGEFKPYLKICDMVLAPLQAPNPYRWSPLANLTTSTDFIDGLFFIAGNEVANAYLYQANLSMKQRYFSSYDGEMLFVPFAGELILFTEFGKIPLSKGHIAVIPRGVKYRVELISENASGYICENLSVPFTLPNLGFIGANGLAHPRHFLYPEAHYEQEKVNEVELISKYQNQFWQAESNHSPLNVVAWHGNYAPYSYDLSLFNTINTVSYDHPDPSIFTVLTSESNTAGVANIDFVIFPPRWMVSEHTFRPPYFHRNIMSELMGLVKGQYDAKKEGFLPGGISIHNCMTGHGPDKQSAELAFKQELKPDYYQDTLAFMFETRLPWLIGNKALQHPARQKDYSQCWQDLPLNFKG